MLTPGLRDVLARVLEVNERWEQLAAELRRDEPQRGAGAQPGRAVLRHPVRPLVPLVLLTCRRDVMGAQVNRRVTTIFAWSCAVMIIGMNIFLA